MDLAIVTLRGKHVARKALDTAQIIAVCFLPSFGTLPRRQNSTLHMREHLRIFEKTIQMCMFAVLCWGQFTLVSVVR